ncbi:hypothetical protein COCNU_04G002120 [Cocos nucifera]|uniref:Uncharacterized protein n=1 Tax=Cocos nucifera TaxID=13894 RepID=A0A8K0I4V5_COCNU|nr:hypothetical protein COCNU_04G002120 [Cocos nucifera]
MSTRRPSRHRRQPSQYAIDLPNDLETADVPTVQSGEKKMEWRSPERKPSEVHHALPPMPASSSQVPTKADSTKPPN